MKELDIDIETYSSRDLKECGVYRYAEAEDFTVLLFSYSVDGGAVRCVDLAQGETLPPDIEAALTDPCVVKRAFNATFERVCLSRYLGTEGYLDPRQWRCTMVAAARLGFPLSLGQCAEVLGLEQGKMEEGRMLIRYFSRPTGGKRHYPGDAPERWEKFKEYCKRDVEVEQAVLSRVGAVEIPDSEQRLYVTDQLINDRGVAIDSVLVENAVRFDAVRSASLLARAREITGLDNPNSLPQLKEWIHRRTGVPVSSLNKSDLPDLEQRFRFHADVREVLELRKESGKTSTKKYRAMTECVCRDGRIRGLLQFYGSRTGRWAGRLVQVQNLPKNRISDIDYARSLVRAGDFEDFTLNYGDAAQVLSELIRTAFTGGEGRDLHVCDFSAIEARVVAWLAGEEWVLEAFRAGKDIYCETASRMFGVPVEKHGVNADLRDKGKIAALALGYGGGIAALEAMGGLRMGLSEREMRRIVDLWRSSNPNIVRLWRILDAAATRVVETGETLTVHRGIELSMRRGLLLIKLPSGRSLCYPRAGVAEDEGRRRITYEGLSQTTRKWCSQTTYGGKLTENIVQAIARDLLAEVLMKAEAAGLRTVFHVHDEIVVEDADKGSLERIERFFAERPRWCPDLPLTGAGYSTPYYLKD